MTKELKRVMREYIQDKPNEEYLFKSRNGINQPISRKRAYEILREIADDFGLKSVPILRKTYGCQPYKKFNNVATIMTALNHTANEKQWSI